ncbi:elongator complex 5 [Fusarium albosuccineum]|uniref:Elongator complex protein 5 n=1 Tax=Fusarium albosuccineum TaxID=1237068 RepID=A0A8H4L304_9HYPO|nr:elongator complex 5 [Fusarium albosuccineum]
MADQNGATIVVNANTESAARRDARSSSPLSSVPDLDDTASKPIQPDTSSESQAKPDEATKTPAQKKNGKKKVVVRKGTRKSKWDAENILTDPKSPLATADLRSILSNPMAWDVLDQQEKAEILALFPDDQHIEGSTAEDRRPNFASLMNDDSFRYDCAAYTENIAQGRHDPDWLASAWAAHERRKAGDFDEYLDNKFRDEWEVELPPELQTRREPAVSRSDSDAKMEGTQAAETGDHKSTDTPMEDVTMDQQGDLQKENGTDERQAGSQEQKEQKVVTVGQVRDWPRAQPWIMAPTSNVHARSHSLLLLQKLLNLRDGASPLTLVIDNLEQPARPLLNEFVSRAKAIIFLSLVTLKKPQEADIFIKAAGRDLQSVRKDLLDHYPAFNPLVDKGKPAQRAVVVIDSLNALAAAAPQSLASFLSSIITPAVSIVATYHDDVPVVLPRSFSEYEPHPFTVLCHLATAILRLSSLYQEIERQKARNRSVQEPEWGLNEDREGVLVGLGERGKERNESSNGVVIHMELRRRSGRTVSERFILMPPTATTSPAPGKVCLLTDHPMFTAPADSGEMGDGEEEPESTFNLGLTEKQRKDREGIVLPYFDAQTDIGAGEGGRILYEMGREDDFDDEEDEI